MSTEIRGIPRAKHNPFADDTPILSPVYDPGPLLTLTAERSLEDTFESSKIELINTCNLFE